MRQFIKKCPKCKELFIPKYQSMFCPHCGSMLLKEFSEYSIYTIELDRKVIAEKNKFRKKNPNMDELKVPLYVGYTKSDPEDRFLEHKNGGIRSSPIVRDYGIKVRYDIIKWIFIINTKELAEKHEEEVAEALRNMGYGVWSGYGHYE